MEISRFGGSYRYWQSVVSVAQSPTSMGKQRIPTNVRDDRILSLKASDYELPWKDGELYVDTGNPVSLWELELSYVGSN